MHSSFLFKFLRNSFYNSLKPSLFLFLSILPIKASFSETITPELLGLIIRPQFIYHLVEQYSSDQEEKAFNVCLSQKDLKKNSIEKNDSKQNTSPEAEIYISGTFKTDLQTPVWSSKQKGALVIESALKSIHFTANLYEHCPRKDGDQNAGDSDQTLGSQPLGQISAQTSESFAPLPIGLWILPYYDSKLGTNSRLKIEVASEIHPEALSELKFSSPNLPKLTSILNTSAVRRAILRASLKPLGNVLTDLINEKLRGLAFAESVLGIFHKSAIWSDTGISVQRGAIQLQNSARSLTRRELLFAFYPRSSGSIFIEPQQIELYANAGFLGGKELDSLGLEGDKEERLSQLKETIKNKAISTDAKLQRAKMSKTSSDITLVFTEELVNKALQSIYLEDLLKFNSSINLKNKVEGLLTKEPADLSVRVQLGSESFPRLLFEPNRLSLQVSDYFLNIGTWIEDRLIPSTQIQAQVNVSAKLEVDPETQSVNLVLDSKTFTIQLSELRKTATQLGEQELQLLEKVSKEVWSSFFQKFPQLPLFSTLFEAAGSSINIQEVEVVDDLIFVHMNLETADSK